MNAELTAPEAGAALEALRERAAQHEARAISTRTVALYRQDWAGFEAWCRGMGLAALPAKAETVALYLTDLAAQVKADGTARYKPSTIGRRKAAIAAVHRRAGHQSPTASDRVSLTLRGIRRDGDSTVRRMRPLLLADVQQIIDAMDHHLWPAGVKAARDRAIILFGFAGALRRSSVAALLTGEVERSESDGLLVRLSRSKTDQEGVGRTIALPFGRSPATCPPCAWEQWLRVRSAADRASRMREVFEVDVTEHICREPSLADVAPTAPAFVRVRADATVIEGRPLTTEALYQLVKVRMSAAALTADGYGFHSLRAGFVTQARRNGASARAVRRQTGHQSTAMVEVYDREYNPLGGNAVGELGL